MPASTPVRTRRWQAIGITIVVGALALGAAAAGWWYARESPPHQGPLVLVVVDGLAPTDPATNGARAVPAVDVLSREGVVFTRAYAHALQTLPGVATLLTGRLPFEHGVRDDGGFVLRSEVRTLAELLRNRGFATGGAVSTYLLRRETGIAQGFTFFDSEFSTSTRPPVVVERTAEQTTSIGLKWLEAQRGQRFFLFLEVPRAGADAAVGSVVVALKNRSLYDTATIVVVGGRGGTTDGATLDDARLRVAFVVKQPNGALAGQRVSAPVQLADIVPTILDLVRAPIPGGLHGRSLRPVLDDVDGAVPARPLYAESLAGYYRLGTAPLFALTTDTRRLLRGVDDAVVAVAPEKGVSPAADPVPDTVPLGAVLDELVGASPPSLPRALTVDEEMLLALTGFLAGPEPRPDGSTQPMLASPDVLDAHRRAAMLVGAGRLADAVQALQGIVKAHPSLGAVHYEIGRLMTRSGRLDEAAAALARAEQAWSESFPIALALSDVLRRAGKLEQAKTYAETAIARAERGSAQDRMAAHESAARVALALKDAAAATSHATVSAEVDPTSHLQRFVKGRLLFDAGKFEEAVEAFSEESPSTAGGAASQATTVAELEWYKGESLTRLDRADDAEAAFRREIAAFPRDPRAYLSLATLYRTIKPGEVEEVLEQLMDAVPTPEGYGLAATAWASAGDTRRAEAIRAGARVKFRGDPTLVRLVARGGRR